MAEEIIHPRVPDLPSVSAVTPNFLIPAYSPETDLLHRVPLSQLALEAAAQEGYTVYEFEEGTPVAPVFYARALTMVLRSNILYRLAHTARPYGSTNFEEELLAGDWVALTAPAAAPEHALSAHMDVTLTNLQVGQVLKWNGTAWVNAADDNDGTGGSSEELDPVFSASPAGGITAQNIANWNSAFSSLHTHSNKTVLDGITAAKVSNWDAAYSWGNHAGLYLAASHPASGVTAQKITNWDSAFASSHSHSNKAVLDGITSTKVSNWDAAYADRHTHANKAVLDGITSTSVSNWNAAYSWGNHAAAGYLTSLPAHALTAHSDVTINTPAPNQVLYYNGTAWVNGITPGLSDYLPKNLTANTQLYLANRSFSIGSASGGIMEMSGQGLDITALFATYKGHEIATVNDLGGAGGPHAITTHTDFVGAAPENGEALVWAVDGVNDGFRAAAPTREAFPTWFGAGGGVADFSEKITQPVTAITEGGTLWVSLPVDKAASFGVPIYIYNNGDGTVEFDQPVQMGGGAASNITQLTAGQAIKIVSYGSWFQGYMLRGLNAGGGSTQPMSNNRLAGSLTALIDSTNGTVTTGVFKEDIFQESGSISFGESTANDLKAGSRMFSDFNSTQLIDGATLNVGAQGSTGSGGDRSSGALYGYMGNYAHFKTAASQSKNVDSRVQLDGAAQASQAAVKLESQYSITNITGKTDGIRRSTFEAFANGDIEPEARITLYRGNTQGMQYNAQYQFRNTGIYLNGSLLISPSGDVSMALGDLTNVSTVGATNGQALVFNGTSWAPGTVSGGGDGHSHTNKTVLDGITATNVTNWNTAFTNNHTHANKAALDTVTAAKITNWDAAYGWGNHASAGYVPSTRTVAGKALSANVTLVKADVGLGSVDNTSDATKNSATATLTNKTISGSSNTLSNIPQSAVTGLAADLAGKASTAVATTSAAGLMSAADKAKLDAQLKTMATLTLSDSSTTTANVSDNYNFVWSPATAARTLTLQNAADGMSWAIDVLTCNGQAVTFGAVSGVTEHRIAGASGTVTGVTLPTGGKVITLLGRRRGASIMWAILEY